LPEVNTFSHAAKGKVSALMAAEILFARQNDALRRSRRTMLFQSQRMTAPGRLPITFHNQDYSDRYELLGVFGSAGPARVSLIDHAGRSVFNSSKLELDAYGTAVPRTFLAGLDVQFLLASGVLLYVAHLGLVHIVSQIRLIGRLMIQALLGSTAPGRRASSILPSKSKKGAPPAFGSANPRVGGRNGKALL
jgi:hypothetical protein